MSRLMEQAFEKARNEPDGPGRRPPNEATEGPEHGRVNRSEAASSGPGHGPCLIGEPRATQSP
jgi:hypothetical protein